MSGPKKVKSLCTQQFKYPKNPPRLQIKAATPRRPLKWRQNLKFSLGQREFYMLSGKISKIKLVYNPELGECKWIVWIGLHACTYTRTSIHTTSSTGSHIFFELWRRQFFFFFISAVEPHILLCAEKLIWTSQIEENESSRFCFPVVPIDGNLYRGLSHMLLRCATSTCLQFTFPGPGNPGNRFLQTWRWGWLIFWTYAIFHPVTLINL